MKNKKVLLNRLKERKVTLLILQSIRIFLYDKFGRILFMSGSAIVQKWVGIVVSQYKWSVV